MMPPLQNIDVMLRQAERRVSRGWELAEAGAIVRATDGTDREAGGGCFVGAEDFGASHFAGAIETDRVTTKGLTGRRRGCCCFAGAAVEDRSEDFAVAGAAPKDATDRVASKRYWGTCF